MKKYLKGLLVAALCAGLVWPAWDLWAGFNIRQNDDGTTDYVRNGVDDVEEAIPVGQIHLSTLVSDVATEGTSYIVIPVTGMRVTSLRAAFATQPSVPSTGYVRMYHLDTRGNVMGEVTNGVTGMRLGASVVMTGTSAALSASDVAINRFTQNHVLAIYTDGNLGNNTIATHFIVTLEPR